MVLYETSEDADEDSSDNTVDEKFYNPLCLTGYLTPLQRKKLRERRNLQPDDVLSPPKPVSVIKKRGIKRKKENSVGISKEQRKKRRSKERIPGVQFTAAKVILKTVNSDGKDKKFFKTSSVSRLEKANFTMPLVFKKDLFINIDKCVKETLSYSRKRPNLKKISLINDNNAPDSDCAEVTESSNVFATTNINTKENCRPGLQIKSPEAPCIIKCHSIGDENSGHISDPLKERSVFDFDWPSDELLLKRQEEARAVVRKLNCLKESNVPLQENSVVLEEKQCSDPQPVKLYPIFNITKKKQPKSTTQEVKSSPKRVIKRKVDSSKKGEQMFIDAGQKEIGAKICKTCNMVYTIGQEEDERLHSNYHDLYLTNLRFPGWKEENVIGEYMDGRVIMVRAKDKTVKLKKIEDVMTIANRDLGFPSSAMPRKPDLTFILFISNTKQVAGCMVAEPISSACQVLSGDSKSSSSDPKEGTWRIGNWYSSSETFPAICGINRIWVAHSFRRHKVASRMMDCLRCSFIHGHIVGIRELAFTDPSPDGRAFAAAYSGTDHFLVYK